MACVAMGAIVTTLLQLTGMFIGSIIMGIGLTDPSIGIPGVDCSIRRENRALIFSIKQSGIPAGGMMFMLTTPLFIEVWTGALPDMRFASQVFDFYFFVCEPETLGSRRS